MWKRQAAAQTATYVNGTDNLIRGAESAGVQSFVHTSSVSAYSRLVQGTLHEAMMQRGGESWINYERALKCAPGKDSNMVRLTWSVASTRALVCRLLVHGALLKRTTPAAAGAHKSA